jgi:uncharacterized protein
MEEIVNQTQVLPDTAVSKNAESNGSPKLTTIVKPTYACNLGCIYCYEAGRHKIYDRMKCETVSALMQRLADYHGPNNEISIIWHGGEPLLMGLEFYNTAVKFQKELGPEYRFKNSIQTNGTLLNDSFINFFAQNNFCIGFSLDGPDWLNDKTRPLLNGSGSYKSIFSNIKKIQSLEPAQKRLFGGALVVLSQVVIDHLQEIYELFRENNINFKLCPLYYEGRAFGKQQEIGITPHQYGDALLHLFDLWRNDLDSTIQIEPFTLIIGNMLTRSRAGCQFGGDCFNHYMAVGPQGDTYPCGRWTSGESFNTGNIIHHEIKEVLNSPVIAHIKEKRLLATTKCAHCRYYSICHSGCLDNGYMVKRDLSDRDYYCLGYGMVMEHLDNYLKSFTKLFSDAPDSSKPDLQFYSPFYQKFVSFDQIPHSALRQMLQLRIMDEGYICWDKHTDYTEYGAYSDHRDHAQESGGWRY